MASSRLNRDKRRAVGAMLRFTLATSFHVQSELFRLSRAHQEAWTDSERHFFEARVKLLDRINADLVKLADRTK